MKFAKVDYSEERRRKVFNDGSDARLAAVLPTANPYASRDRLHYWWEQGWIHADLHWGADAKGRIIKPLPKLDGVPFQRRRFQPSSRSS